MESTALNKAELAGLVEGWSPRIMEAGQDLMSNLGSGAGGALYRKRPMLVKVLGGLLQVGNALAGPRHPWIQMATRPGVGLVDAAIAIEIHEMTGPGGAAES